MKRSLSALGSGSLAFTAHSTYERNEMIHGVDAAVIQTTMHMPLDISIDLGKVASRFGSASAPGLPQLTSGTIRYSGSADVTVTSWLDFAKRHLEKMTEDANLDVGFTLVGASVPNNPGRIGMKGSMTLTLERVR